jgi:hypothetical protein
MVQRICGVYKDKINGNNESHHSIYSLEVYILLKVRFFVLKKNYINILVKFDIKKNEVISRYSQWL